MVFRPTRLLSLAALFTIIAISLSTNSVATLEGHSTSLSPQQQVRCWEKSAQPFSLFVPLAHARFFGGATIVLNSRGTSAKAVTPTWFVEGRGAVTADPIVFQPGIKFASIESLLPPGVPLRLVEGLSFSYSGKDREIWSQITLTPKRGAEPSQSLEAIFSMDEDFKSSKREAVWTTHGNRDHVVLVLSNVSGQPLHVTVDHENAPSHFVLLGPSETKTLSFAGRDRGEGNADWIHLDSEGAVSALRATGFVLSRSDMVPHLIRFYDPSTAAQEKLFATNVPTRSKTAVALRNLSSKPLTATIEVLDARDGATLATLPDVRLAADAGRSVSLNHALQSLGDDDHISLRIRNTGPAGSLIGSIESSSDSTSLDFEMPLRDSGGLRNSTGAYPWRVDADFETVVSVTNVGSTPALYGARILYDGGEYVFAPTELAMGATAVFDLRKLRDSQAPDAYGRTLPRDIDHGQFRWTLRDHRAGAHFLGRAQLTSRTQRVSSSYSCFLCCTDSFSGGLLTPGSLDLGYGGGDVVDVSEHMRDCYGGEYYQPATVSSWSSYDTGVASISQDSYTASVGAVSYGETQATGYWESVEAVEAEIVGGGCEIDSTPAYVYLPVTVEYCPGQPIKSQIIKEYKGEMGGSWAVVGYTPACGDFSTTGLSSHFSWSELVHSGGDPHTPTAIIVSGLWGALEQTRTNYGNVSLHIESGYRCPHGNYANGGRGQSRHMWGDAVDMWPIGVTWNHDTWLDLRAAARNSNTGFTYEEDWDLDHSHLHVDMRPGGFSGDDN